MLFLVIVPVYATFTKLQNTASICYQNSVLQCLLTSPVVGEVLVGDGHVAEALRSLHARILPGEITDAADVRAAMGGDWAGGSVQDSLEYLTALRQAQQGGIAATTELQVEEQLMCMACGTVTRSRGQLAELSIHFSSDAVVDLQRAVDELVAEEPVDVTCEFCPGVMSLKSTRLTNSPNMLVIHLMRATFDPVAGKSVKSSKKLDCPLRDLRLSGAVYDLHGTVEHLGVEPEGGHFAAHLRHRDTSEWYDVDDEQIRPCSADDVITSNSYLLFYVKRS